MKPPQHRLCLCRIWRAAWTWEQLQRILSGWEAPARGYRFQCELSSQPAESSYLIPLRLPRCPSCHSETRWRCSRSHLSRPTDASQTRSSTDCDSCVTSQAQRAPMLPPAPMVPRPIWPFLDVRMCRLHECSVGRLSIWDKRFVHALIWRCGNLQTEVNLHSSSLQKQIAAYLMKRYWN